MSCVVMKFDLKQITPMIHFQADECGAILRASEVKPKLDAFITKKVGRIDPDWLIDKDKSALNYKMRIRANGKRDITEKINKMYFGNMGQDGIKKKTILYSDTSKIQLEIICFIESLREIIEDSIIDFFLTTNFGSRQSKGFGSFLCKKKGDKSYLEWNAIKKSDHYGDKKLIWADFSKNKSIEEAMNNAAMVYAIMKSGINRSKKREKKYIKGFLNAGAGTGNRGDKAFIKSKDYLWRNNNEIVGKRKIEEEDRANDNHYDHYEFFRILLGMADHYKFNDPDKKRQGTVYVRNFEGVTIDGDEIIGEEELKENIVRFKSPITMKIYQAGIIFIFDPTPGELLGKWFYISRNTNAEKKKSELKVESFIKTPESWDWEAFINNFMDYYKNYKENILRLVNTFKGEEFLNLRAEVKTSEQK